MAILEIKSDLCVITSKKTEYKELLNIRMEVSVFFLKISLRKAKGGERAEKEGEAWRDGPGTPGILIQLLHNWYLV